MMYLKENLPRLLGAAQLFVFLASLVSEQLLTRITGKGDISSILRNISSNIPALRISSLVALVNSLGIIILGIFFYLIFREDYQTLALIALVFFILEGLVLAGSKYGSFGLIPISREFEVLGISSDPSLIKQADFLYNSIDRRGYDIHMLFFCLGAMIWYYLLSASGIVPKPLATWGLVAVSLIFIPTILVLINREWTSLLVMGLPYAPFELVFGLWLVINGKV